MLAGARIIKTGIAVTISMYICLHFDIQPAIFAAAAAVLNMQPSLGMSLSNAKEQVLIHIISISIAITLGVIIGSNPISMGLSTILVILTCSRFKLRAGMAGGIMASIFILGSPPTEFLSHALTRSLAIFIGIGAALLVNAVIVPPRYSKPLRSKLCELNNVIAAAFCDAAHGFLNADNLPPDYLANKKKEIDALFKQSRHLYELFRYNLGPASEKEEDSAQEIESKLYNDYLSYNKGLWQRTRDIHFLTEERVQRRKKAGEMPISPEFLEILDLLDSGLLLFTSYNNELQNKLSDKKFDKVNEPHIWRKLDDILNRWHDRFPTGSYYLHALIEVSLVTYKIRWAAKESASLLDTEVDLG